MTDSAGTAGSRVLDVPGSPRRWLTRLRNLITQGLILAHDAPSDDRPLSEIYIEIADHGPRLRDAQSDISPPLDDGALADLSAAGIRDVDLVFAGESCLEISFGLPDAPLHELRAMIESEIQYRSPFSADASVSFWTAEEKPDGRWRITAAVTLRAPTMDLVARLARHGLAVGTVRWNGGTKTFAARPDWTQERTEGKEMGWKAALRGLSPVWKATVIGVAMLNLSAMLLLAQTTFRHSAVSQQADKARLELSRTAQATATLRALGDARAMSTERLALTGVLADLLPDGVWLDQLLIEDVTVTLVGFGPSAAEVTRLLTSLPQITDIRFGSPVTRDNSQGLERFRILATLSGPVE
ncbi:PilN domain-containing protein [Jannaschia aquimarina]|uniref:Fimbrial assembly protein (PilN) n=1 Tax=Jannaschia aquimarina TaxID=935700 RepID=A0A0D1EJ94_9RHOB|nr:PilN domain-containing protein [Jannaschia aquimarina]KIT15870.1 Fimbrial assembly protein (PilN) [Jannaschia aquimarina]SNT10441.1 Fimbrial assembly protein (PilN) [Jannaschia aquimarina]